MELKESIDELTNELIELERKKKSFLNCDQNAEYEFDDFLDNGGTFDTYKMGLAEFDPSEILKTRQGLYRKWLSEWCPNQIPYIDNEITRLKEELDSHSKQIEDSWVRVIPKKEYDDALESILRSEFLIGDSSYFIYTEEVMYLESIHLTHSLYIEIEEYSFYVCCSDIPEDFSYEEVEVFIEQIKEGISN
jgi:hypothetical protein